MLCSSCANVISMTSHFLSTLSHTHVKASHSHTSFSSRPMRKASVVCVALLSYPLLFRTTRAPLSLLYPTLPLPLSLHLSLSPSLFLSLYLLFLFHFHWTLQSPNCERLFWSRSIDHKRLLCMRLHCFSFNNRISSHTHTHTHTHCVLSDFQPFQSPFSIDR